jgi:hypothetical protein
MKKLQTLTTSTAIALASVGGTAFAQEAQTNPVVSDTAVNEPALVAKSQMKPVEKTEVPAPSTVKPALDAQKAVVKDAEAKIDTAKADVKEKEATVASNEKEVATATQAVKDAEATASQVTPEKVAQVKDAQAKNLEAQTANQEATEATNAQIKSETKILAEKQSDVATAKENLDQAEKDVQTAEQTVANAESALDGTGLANAEKDLKEAQKGVKDAETTVSDAQTAFKNATKADADRDETIKSAETDVNTKNDAVKLAKEKLTTANQHAKSVDAKLQSAQDELTKAQDALENVDIVKIADLTQFKKDKAEGDSDLMTDSGATVIENSSTKISEADKKRTVDLDNLTDEEQKEISLYASKVLTEIHKQFGLNEVTVTDSDLRIAREQAKKYVARGIAVNKAGHINGAYHGENISLANETHSMSMYQLKQTVFNAIMGQTFADAPSKWGHSRNNFVNNTVGITTANVDGRLHIISTLDLAGGNVIEDKTDIATLEKAVATAEENVKQATTASENAKNALTTASTDYASALSLKTEAEKVLADAMATPLQAQVAENNLRLANIALENAKKREATASEAVANFSASLADKKTALKEAKQALKDAKLVQTIASQALENVSAKLEDQETKLNNLNKQVTKLLAEKDALVKEAKELAEQLQAYLDAPVALANAQDAQAKAEAKLAQAKAELTKAQSTLEDLLTAQKAEEAKLAELEATYAKLVDLAEKAQENVVATLPDGTVIAIPKGSPTAEVLPELNLEELQKALATGKEVTLDAQGKVVVKEKRETYSAPAVKSVENEKMSYSRVEKAKTLPNTGENSSVAMLVIGAILGTFGLVTVRRKN